MLVLRFLLAVAGLSLLPWACAAAPTALPASALPRLTALLPGSGQTAQIMKMGSRLALVDLQRRVVNVGGSRQALQTVMASAARGEAPAYDPRLGLSREEFSRYVAFQPVLMGTGKFVKLAVVRDAFRLTFSDAPANSVLRGLSFDLRSGDLRVPEGFVFRGMQVIPSAAATRDIDIRSAFIWNVRAFNAEAQNGVHGQVSLYQLGDGQVLLGYHRLSSLVHGVFNNTESELIVKYTR